PEVGFLPKPAQDRLPIWVGGNTEAAYRRVARIGDGFHAAFEPIEDVSAAWKRIRELCGEEGRDPREVRLSIRLYLDPGGSMEPKKSIAGAAHEMVDTVQSWAAVGVDHILLDPVARGGLEGRVAAMEQFMA